MVVRDAHLQIPGGGIRAGDRLYVQYEQEIVRPGRVRSLTISLVCREGPVRIVDDPEGGTSESWDASERIVETFREGSPVPGAGNLLRAACAFQLTEGAPTRDERPNPGATFVIQWKRDNWGFRRKWVLRTKLDLRGWPDYSEEYEIVVRRQWRTTPENHTPLFQRSDDATLAASDQGASSHPAEKGGTHLTRRAVDWYRLPGDTFPETRNGLIPAGTSVTPTSSVLNGWVRVRLDTGDEVWVVEDALEPT